jgi:acyl carrier protein
MTKEEITDQVKTIVSDTLKVDMEKLSMESRFTEDLGADSLDKVLLLMTLEDEFKKSISDSEAVTLTSIGTVVEFIENSIRPERVKA